MTVWYGIGSRSLNFSQSGPKKELGLQAWFAASAHFPEKQTLNLPRTGSSTSQVQTPRFFFHRGHGPRGRAALLGPTAHGRHSAEPLGGHGDRGKESQRTCSVPYVILIRRQFTFCMGLSLAKLVATQRHTSKPHHPILKS